jgi:GNAT superfamily N-acetyltransferase
MSLSYAKYEIRMGRDSDHEAIAAIDEFGGSRTREIDAGLLFVAQSGLMIVGYVSYEPRGLLGQPLLTFLCVRKDYRRRGVATSLVKFVEKVARGRKLISSTEAWCVGTQQIFQKLGWQPIGSLSGINKDGSDELFYATAIDA